MYKSKKIVAIIPARGKSKRIPKKNIIMLAGKPLISYTIEVAKKSKIIDRIIVSTEDDEIAKISRRYGAEVIERPKKLSKDKTSMISVLKHIVLYLNEKERYISYIIVLLQPTSPLRAVEDIDGTIKILLENNADSAETFCEVSEHPASFFKINKEGYATPFDKKNYKKQSRDLPKVYKENGAVFAIKTEILIKKNTLYGKKHIAFLMPKSRSIDIDEPVQLKLAEWLIKYEKNKNR